MARTITSNSRSVPSTVTIPVGVILVMRSVTISTFGFCTARWNEPDST
ncbi:Uncharacterised protein [Mycobacteroides abscessus subsp. abscessus]|nr:Uncharacterised protein [Mycobacteroides abscessus subsp. abscessus]SKU94970.1 Uncharacterised protein [Mycobacteroides abscessus subsp. abscessus]